VQYPQSEAQNGTPAAGLYMRSVLREDRGDPRRPFGRGDPDTGQGGSPVAGLNGRPPPRDGRGTPEGNKVGSPWQALYGTVHRESRGDPGRG